MAIIQIDLLQNERSIIMEKDGTLRFAIFLIALTILSSMAQISIAQQTNTVTANVVVVCPFSVRLTPQSLYPQVGNIIVNYTVVSTAACNATVTGTARFYNPSYPANSVVLNISAKSSNSISEYQLEFNSLLLYPGRETAQLTLKDPQTNQTNLSTKTFELVGAANLSIVNLSVPGVYVGSPAYFYMSVLNAGGYSASNIIAHWKVTGPATYSANIPINPMAGQNATENISSEQNNITSLPGTYSLALYLSYESIGIGKRTKNYSISYTVLQHRQNSGAPTSLPPPNISTSKPLLTIESTPVLISGAIATSISYIKIKNGGNSTEQVNITVPKYSFLSLSATSISLLPNESVYVQLALNRNNVTGSYVIPINITATSGGLTNTQKEFIMYRSQNESRSQPIISTQINLLNGTGNALGTIQITAPNATPINNIYVKTSLPVGIASNISDISAYGLPSTINGSDGRFNITWNVPYVGSGGSVYAYFTIRRPQSISSIPSLDNTVFQPSTPQRSILKIISASVPSAHPNSTIKIKATILYTGTSAQQLYVQLSPPINATVSNQSQVFTVTPDSLIYVEFLEVVGNYNGTLINTLQASTNGSVQQESIPAFVTPLPPIQTTTQVSTQETGISRFLPTDTDQIIGAIVTLLIIAAVLISAHKGAGWMTAKKHERELTRINERIKKGSYR